MKSICVVLVMLGGLNGRALAAELPRLPGPCDHPTRPGAYKAGEWEYVYTVEARGSRSEKRVGLLKRGGAEVPGKGGAVIETPLGRFKYFATRYNTGWLNTLTFDGAVFPEAGLSGGTAPLLRTAPARGRPGAVLFLGRVVDPSAGG